MREGDLIMGPRERARLDAMKRVDRKDGMTLSDLSEELGISIRQVKRIRKRYLEEGDGGVVSRRRGKPSNRKIADEKREHIMRLLKEKYVGFGPTLAGEKLKKREGLEISADTLSRWMAQEDLWKPRKRKKGRVYQRRNRRRMFGELLQVDGSHHDWFEGRGARCVLLLIVDDATSRIVAARFFPSETAEGYIELLEEHFQRYGRPRSIYSDRHSIFRVTKDEVEKGKGITHFGRVLQDLDIELICANSPQAKGRVERKHAVLQDRLVKEMRLLGINTIERGNAFLPTFIEEMNARFGCAPCDEEDAHRPLRKEDDLKRIFMRRDTRVLSKNLTFQHNNILYMVQTETPNRLRGKSVEVLWDGGNGVLGVIYDKKELAYKRFEEVARNRPAVLDRKEVTTVGLDWATKKPRKKQPANHPWRRG